MGQVLGKMHYAKNMAEGKTGKWEEAACHLRKGNKAPSGGCTRVGVRVIS